MSKWPAVVEVADILQINDELFEESFKESTATTSDPLSNVELDKVLKKM